MYQRVAAPQSAPFVSEPASDAGPETAAHLALARVYRERKQLIDAKRAAEQALSLEPQSQEAKQLLKELAKSA